MNILILTSGKISKLDGFSNKEGVTLGSFSDICFDSNSESLTLKTVDLKQFAVIYFRMVGKSLEIATLVAEYAIKNNIKLVDNMYANSLLMPVSLAKSLEMRRLAEVGIKIPRTVFPVGIEASGDFSKLNFPYVVKSTTGQKAREVWMVKSEEELDKLRESKFEKGKYYFAQELVSNAERIRVLVIGGRAVGAIKRQTKWNKSEVKETLSPIPEDIADLAIKSAKAVNLDICGVDILQNSETNEMFIIEANAAPSWKLINKYCGVSVEDEIIKFIQTKI